MINPELVKQVHHIRNESALLLARAEELLRELRELDITPPKKADKTPEYGSRIVLEFR